MQIVMRIVTTAMMLFWMGLPCTAQVPLEFNPSWSSTEYDYMSTGMVWSDLDRDGFIDVFFSNGNDIERRYNMVYMSESGTMRDTASWYSTDLKYSGRAAGGDINDDGYQEIFVSNYLGNCGFDCPDFTIMYSNVAGVLSSYPTWATQNPVYSFSPALGDADNDGDLDLALATGEMFIAHVRSPDALHYNYDGEIERYPGWQSARLASTMDVKWGDVDNDGDLDLAFGYDGMPPSIYLNQGGIFAAFPDWQADDEVDDANSVLFGDINNDGWLDLIVAFNNHLNGAGYFRAYFNDGAGQLSSAAGWQSDTQGKGSALALYDYDNDGDDDLAAGRWWEQAKIYENVDGNFTTSPIWIGHPLTVVEALCWVDVNRDGVEAMADTIYPVDSRSLFYLRHHPLYSLDSVFCDGAWLGYAQYCYDRVDAWISLADPPAESLIVYYSYSFTNDLAVANWDTYNQIFANTSPTLIHFGADTVLGHVPFEARFRDSCEGATGWLWHFGDGDSSSVQHPDHVYTDPGVFDIRLAAEFADGWHNGMRKNMIVVLADTLFFPQVHSIHDDTIKVTVSLRNCHPIETIQLPLYFGGEAELDMVGFDVESCRTEYFESVALVGYSQSGQKMALSLRAGTPGLSLPPGRGEIVNIYFVRLSGTGINTLDTATAGGRELLVNAGYAAYQPRVTTGEIILELCGDINGDGAPADIGDLVYLIDYYFGNGPPPADYDMANVDGMGDLDIADLIYLVEYMFAGGPHLQCPS